MKIEKVTDNLIRCTFSSNEAERLFFLADAAARVAREEGTAMKGEAYFCGKLAAQIRRLLEV